MFRSYLCYNQSCLRWFLILTFVIGCSIHLSYGLSLSLSRDSERLRLRLVSLSRTGTSLKSRRIHVEKYQEPKKDTIGVDRIRAFKIVIVWTVKGFTETNSFHSPDRAWTHTYASTESLRKEGRRYPAQGFIKERPGPALQEAGPGVQLESARAADVSSQESDPREEVRVCRKIGVWSRQTPLGQGGRILRRKPNDFIVQSPTPSSCFSYHNIWNYEEALGDILLGRCTSIRAPQRIWWKTLYWSRVERCGNYVYSQYLRLSQWVASLL